MRYRPSRHRAVPVADPGTSPATEPSPGAPTHDDAPSGAPTVWRAGALTLVVIDGTDAAPEQADADNARHPRAA